MLKLEIETFQPGNFRNSKCLKDFLKEIMQGTKRVLCRKGKFNVQ